MYFQAPSPRVSFGASFDLTREWLKSGVRQLVSLQMSFGYIVDITGGTIKGTLTCVSPYMSFQVSRFRDFFETVLIGTNKHLLFVLGTRDLFNVI